MSDPQMVLKLSVDTFVAGSDMYIGSNPRSVLVRLMPDGTMQWLSVVAHDSTVTEPEGSRQ